MLKKLEIKFKMIWLVLSAQSVHITFQRSPGTQTHTVAFGHSDLVDLVLFAKEMQHTTNEFMDMITESAAEAGDLHALEELKEAVEVIHNVGQ